MIDNIKKNLSVLRQQFIDFVFHAKIDIENGVRAWKYNRYAKALHNWTMGPLGEHYQHMWRWVMYRDILLVLAAAGVALYAVP